MKKPVAFLFFAAALVLPLLGAFPFSFWKPAASGGVCSPPQGNLLNDEGFQTATTGYQQSGWNTATGTPDPAYSITSLTTSKPNGSCTQGFRSNYASTASWNYNSWDVGSPQSSTVYVRFYLYVASNSIATGGDTVDIAGVFNYTTGMSSGGLCGGVRLSNISGQLGIQGNGATQSSIVNINSAQWYLVELKVVMNGTSEIKINQGTPQTFTSTGYTSWRTIGVGSYNSSADAYTFNDSIFDLLAADSTGYIGPTP